MAVKWKKEWRGRWNTKLRQKDQLKGFATTVRKRDSVIACTMIVAIEMERVSRFEIL